MEIRFATKKDAAACLEIYRPYVQKTAITFEYDVPSVTEFARRIEATAADFPYFAALEAGKIIGYAYASRYRERRAYDWVVELSVYVDENEQHHGTGKILYQKLLSALTKLNYQRAMPASLIRTKTACHFMNILAFIGLAFLKNQATSLNNGGALAGWTLNFKQVTKSSKSSFCQL